MVGSYLELKLNVCWKVSINDGTISITDLECESMNNFIGGIGIGIDLQYFCLILKLNWNRNASYFNLVSMQ